MQREPEHRFQSSREFQHALTSWLMTNPGGLPRTEALPVMPDLTAQTGRHGALAQSAQQASYGGPGHPSDYGAPPDMGANVNMQRSNPSFPGTNTPMGEFAAGPQTGGEMGISQPALAVTHAGQRKRGGLVVALVVVSIGVIGAAAFGAYMLVRRPAVASEGETLSETAASAEPEGSAATEPSAEVDAADSAEVDTADSAEVDTADSAEVDTADSAEVEASAKVASNPKPAPVVRPQPVVRPRPPPPPPKPAEPKPAPSPTPKPGRQIKTTL
jgi:hypothetical protein